MVLSTQRFDFVVRFTPPHAELALEMIAVPVTNVSEARDFITRWPELRKICGWAALLAIGWPALRGVVVDTWNSESQLAVTTFANLISASRLLVRTDKARETPPYPSGGYLLGLDAIHESAPRLIDEGRVLFLLEPRSPFMDRYSLGVLSWPDEPIQVEVVGPGFDSGDLKRGLTSPHESFEFARGMGGTGKGRMLSHTIVDSASYRDSWDRRRNRVRQLLADEHNYSDIGSDISIEIELAKRNERFFLQSRDAYPPVDRQLVERVVADVERLPVLLQGLSLPGEPLMVSMTYFGEETQPIYWDVVWPTLKYEGLSPRRRSGAP